MMARREKPRCEFGARCYRKNPQHLETYFHPHKISVFFVERNPIQKAKKITRKTNRRNSVCGSLKNNENQTTLEFSKKSDFSTAAPAEGKKFVAENDKRVSHSSFCNRKKVLDKEKQNTAIPFKRKRKEKITSGRNQSQKSEVLNCINTYYTNDGLGENTEESLKCVSSKNNLNEANCSSNVVDLKNKTPEEMIKALFLVDMPPDFYSFYEFCKNIEETFPLEPLNFGELKLVGPFDILSGKVNYLVDPNPYLCHWRFYYDPPEFQTVLASDTGYHIGYWRDDPKENPVFLASNNSNEGCSFKIEAENLFGAVFHHLGEFMRIGNPFKKIKIMKLQMALKNWAKKNKFTLDRKTSKITARQKKIVSNTFHGAGIVVPVEAGTELGYRPLIETDAGLQNICELIMKEDDDRERESLWENLQPLITAANIANDECDFGNSLELGIDLFCMGSPFFHETLEHLLTTAYSLLNKIEFAKIIRAHLKFRRKGYEDPCVECIKGGPVTIWDNFPSVFQHIERYLCSVEANFHLYYPLNTTREKMTPRPYSDKSSLPTDPSNDAAFEIPIQNLPETPSPPSFSGATTPSPTPQEEVPIEPYPNNLLTQESNRASNFGATTPCYPTPGDIMPYDHSLPDFIRQITNQSNLANLHSLSLRVISTLISLHRMSTYLPNLRYLDLEGSVLNSLRDIGCSFKNLQILKVGRCQLESLDGTFGLSSLRELYAQKNFINDVSPCSNLPHIRHIDVSGNRIRNISYAGFLSVCSKLRSIVLTENPATEVSDYRKHVRRILPQLETLDGVPFVNEDNTDESKEPEIVESYFEGSDSSSASGEVPDFSSISPSDSMNNFFDLEEDLFFFDKKNKQAKNLANQDLSDIDILEISPDIKTSFSHQEKVQMEQTNTTEMINIHTKQKSASTLKLDKDIENRSKKTNFLSSEKFNETCGFSTEVSECPDLENNISIFDGEEVLTKTHLLDEKSTRPATESSHDCPAYVLRKKVNFGLKKKATPLEVSKPKIGEHTMDRNFGEPSKLTTGLPICGNLTAALRSRKKALNARDEKISRKDFLNDQDGNEKSPEVHRIKRLQVEINASGDSFDSELDDCGAADKGLIEEDVLTTSKKWREAFRRFRSNNRQRNWEELDFAHLLKETSYVGADEKLE